VRPSRPRFMNVQSSPEATAHVAEFALLFLDL
jgi:hypothetical protein